MRENLESLEKKRRSLHRQLEEVGDFRRGTISTNYRKCGKKNCICTSEGHPGHGPQYLWSTTIKGRSYAKSLKLGPELQKFMKETSSYRKHLELCDKIVKVNEEICRLRPVSEIDDKNELDELKKKITESIHEEIQKEIDRIVTLSFKDRQRLGHIDLEPLEQYVRSSMHSIGSIILEEVINSDGGDYRGRTFPCEEGHIFEFKDYREKNLLTLVGPVKVKRAYYYDEQCECGCSPKDTALEIEGSSFSPGVRRVIGRAGTFRPFAAGHEDIKEMAGILVDSKEIERQCHQLGQEVEDFDITEGEVVLSGKVIKMKSVPKMYICMDGTGVPVIKAETANRKGKGKDGRAKTREVKLGCIFTQTTVDEKGYPVRDEYSTSYAGAIETADKFGIRIYREAIRRGLDRAEKVCVIGDGAPWIWNIADEQFYGAIQVVDLYHAREHYWNAAKIAFDCDEKSLKQWTEKRRKELNQGKVEEVIETIAHLSASTKEEQELLEKEIGYFEKNKERMRYDEFRKQGLFVGSGVVEAGCRTVVGQRLKQSGMHWSVKGANNIIALRCCFLSNRWEDFWEYRASS